METALVNFFRIANLERLRELTLRELASQIDLRRREILEDENVVTPDQLMVCLSSRGPNSEKLLRYASRLAGKLNRNWYAVYVQTPSEEATIPAVALGLTSQGVSDTSTEKPIEIVFLILSPVQTPDAQVQVLGLASRAAQSRHLLQRLQSCQTSGEVLSSIRNWDMSQNPSLYWTKDRRRRKTGRAESILTLSFLSVRQ